MNPYQQKLYTNLMPLCKDSDGAFVNRGVFNGHVRKTFVKTAHTVPSARPARPKMSPIMKEAVDNSKTVAVGIIPSFSLSTEHPFTIDLYMSKVIVL
jgi:hypothetical protein